MLCESLMKKDVEKVFVDDPVKLAATKMRDCNVGFLPVIERETEKVVGTITDRDIAIRLVAEGKDGERHVDEVMTAQVVACRPYDEIKRALWLMGNERKSRIMCIDDRGVLCGVISLSDIAQKGDPPKAAETLRQVTKREVNLA